uniref:EOG090X0GKM n=1 Tax=Evadne anonyx TaxID=141404 RepID=A0A9N6WVA5_9CRUS|nr:EOG090X0GKM [Evadne anonyx]
MARHFKEQDIAEFRDCFSLFARNGYIESPDQLAVIMRSLRTSPTHIEMKQYLKSKNGRISFADFLEVMHTHSQKENSSKDIDAAFMASNPNRGRTITEKQLRHILKDTGEKLSTKEVDQIFKEANIKSGGLVKYKEFTKIVVTPVPDYYF